MRRIYLAAFAGMLMLGLPNMPVHAAGNVLVPTDNPPASTPDNSVSPPEGSSSGQISLPRLDPSETDTETGIPQTATPNMTPTPLAAALANDPTLPTKIIKIMATEAYMMPGDEELPNTLQINIKDYSWGPADIDAVTSAVHMDAAEVPKHCRLSLTGMVHTDSETDGVYTFDMGASLSEVIVKYEGNVTNVNIMARAMCDMLPLPPNSRLILQIGDKYAAFVTNTECAPPPSHNADLIFHYSGDGKSACEYQ